MALRGLTPSSDDDGVLASINVIPFVDIVLVLLVVFMLTTSAIVKATLRVELPRAATGGARVATTLNVVVDRRGELSLNGAPSSRAAVAGFVRDAVAKDAKTQAVIAADRGVDYGVVIEIIDLVKQNGVTTFALDVERAAPRAP
jgi:biopolymer transport protein ExbD